LINGALLKLTHGKDIVAISAQATNQAKSQLSSARNRITPTD
jgi:hypothetical protein